MIYALLHDVVHYCPRSSFPPLLENLDCRVLPYHPAWKRADRISWTLGHWVRAWGNRHYGSQWNWFLPYVHEARLASRARAGHGDVVHFLMAEFGSPRHPRWFNHRGAKLVGTFHCSLRRLPRVLARYRCLFGFDRISVMSKTQIPFFVEQGYPADRIDVTFHGVDTDYFHPGSAEVRAAGRDRTLRLLLVGSTERDHVFAAAVMKRLSGAPVRLDVLTAPQHLACYEGLDQVHPLSNLSNAQLIEAYQAADLLFMPLMDCTSNNVILEAMACGTPVMVNRTGGIPEYVDPACNFVFDEKHAETWADAVAGLAADLDALAARRSAVRQWAKTLDWRQVKSMYVSLYDKALAQPPIPGG